MRAALTASWSCVSSGSRPTTGSTCAACSSRTPVTRPTL